MTLKALQFSFIGGGNMASALIGGLLRTGVSHTAMNVVERNPQAREALLQQFSIQASASPNQQLSNCDVVILAVKPQHFRAMTIELQPYIKQQLLFSVAAGIRLDTLQMWFNGHQRIVRAMPNTPSLIGAGMTGLVATAMLSEEDREIATHIAQAVGESLWVKNDAQIDALTALSGSGPAYVFYLIEAMQAAGIALGLDAKQSKKLITSTLIGAAQLAQQSDETPEQLRQRVTSPGGTTFEALHVLEIHQVKQIFQEALSAAAARSAEIGKILADSK